MTTTYAGEHTVAYDMGQVAGRLDYYEKADNANWDRSFAGLDNWEPEQESAWWLGYYHATAACRAGKLLRPLTLGI